MKSRNIDYHSDNISDMTNNTRKFKECVYVYNTLYKATSARHPNASLLTMKHDMTPPRLDMRMYTMPTISIRINDIFRESVFDNGLARVLKET